MQLVMFGFKIKTWKPVNESSKVTQSLMEQKQERLLSDIFSYIYDDCIWESYLVLKSLDLWTMSASDITYFGNALSTCKLLIKNQHILF